jgi:hypothetical protein
MVRESVFPDEREWAVNQLAVASHQGDLAIEQAVMGSAVRDSAPAVRAACLRGVIRLGVKHASLLNIVQRLQSDSDPRVRYEAEQVMAWIKAGQPPYIAPSSQVVTTAAQAPKR